MTTPSAAELLQELERVKSVASTLYHALNDASSVVDAGDDEEYAYQAELESGAALLGIQRGKSHDNKPPVDVLAEAYQRLLDDGSLSAAAVQWLSAGHRCHSSNTILTAITGIHVRGDAPVSHPLDIGDFGRCRRLLEACPEIAAHMDELAQLSPAWDLFIDKWKDLCSTMDEEAPQWRAQWAPAAKTSAMIKDINAFADSYSQAAGKEQDGEISSLDEIWALLGEEGISASNPRARQVVENLLADFTNARELIAAAVAHEKLARNSWLSNALDPWCARHGLTREQGLSVLFNDSSFNSENPDKDLVTKESIFEWSGQQNDFAVFLMRQKGAEAAHPVLVERERQRG